MEIRTVAFDLDDTLLRNDRTISDYTVRVLRKAHERGIHIIPASGRAQHSMAPFVEQIGCASLYIACNGAELWSPDHQLLNRITMDVETALEVAQFGRDRHCYSQTYAGDCFYYSMRGKWADAYAEATMLTGVYAGDLTKYIHQPTAKILMMDAPETIAGYLTEARAQFAGRLSVSCSKPTFLEFNPLEATKGNALKKAGELLGFSLAEAAAFGDSLNDLSMLRAAGLGVVMANGREDVKHLITTVCPGNMEDGVARYIEQNFLQ